jgi:oxalate decarboxylase/phosphoglucose isomerase-like protein (cupin superfamily)
MTAVIQGQDLRQEVPTSERCFIYETWNEESDRAVSVARARVETGDLVFIPAGASQRITSSGDVDLVFYCLCTPPCVPEAYIDLESPAD